MKKLMAMVLALCLLLAMTTAAFAAGSDAEVKYLDITMDGDTPTGCTYQDTAEGAEGILISGGTNTYALSDTWNGTIIVNGAAVSYSGSSDDYYVLGAGSLALSNVTVRAGSCNAAYTGDSGTALLGFIMEMPAGTTYSYTYTSSFDLTYTVDAYDVTVDADKTLTIKAPIANQENPDPAPTSLIVAHALTVNGSLSADAGQRLVLRENASVSGVTLYDAGGEYQLPAEHGFEVFVYTDGQWMRQPINYSGTKNTIEGKKYAYAGDADAVKAALAHDIWCNVCGPQQPEERVWGSEEAVAAAVTDFELTENVNPYYASGAVYSFKVGLTEELSTETLYVYTLQNSTDFVVETTAVKGGASVCTVVPGTGGEKVVAGDFYRETGDDGRPVCGVAIFGNGAFTNYRENGGNGELLTYQLNSEHYADGATYNAESLPRCSLTIHSTGFKGVKIVGAGDKTAAAWGFNLVPIYATAAAQGSAEAPVYFGNESATITQPAWASGEYTVELAQPLNGIGISESAGAYTLTFGSMFYDAIPLKITYGESNVQYITVRRVGLAMQDVMAAGGSDTVNVFHGSDHWSEYEDAGVYATYYYPDSTSGEAATLPEDRVSLAVTTTYTDNTVEITVIDEGLGVFSGRNQGNTCFEDFLIWRSGDKEYKTIEVIAFVQSGDEAIFGGAKIGSGRGVVWTAADAG